MSSPKTIRNLIIVLGDQLDVESSAFDGFDRAKDAVWMAEVAGESTHVWTHKARITIFLAAMRHFRDALRKKSLTVHYHELDGKSSSDSLREALIAFAAKRKIDKLVMVEPGEHRVRKEIEAAARKVKIQLEVLEDQHFLCDHETFDEYLASRKQPRLEYFYREMRRTTGILIKSGKPVGGDWNFDKENRGSFGREGPPKIPSPRSFKPDAVTRKVIKLVEQRFADHPGSLERFDWPVTRDNARAALADFIENRLPHFGEYQDAMWTGEPFLFHARISAALNLKLLNPREVIAAAEAAYEKKKAPIEAVEGFVRQILGWREYVRGIYWHFMPEYLDRNELKADQPLPPFYWTGDTDMNCLRESIGQTLEYGYAHHIQRLMVTGLFALVLGVRPREVHEWYLAVYVDAVEWVELPNTLGMSQYADGGIMASKPYAATGKYIQRMSNYCVDCRYDPAEATGEKACPFTTLYWDFLHRHQKQLGDNHRMALQLKNLERKSRDEMKTIRKRAEQIRVTLTVGETRPAPSGRRRKK